MFRDEIKRLPISTVQNKKLTIIKNEFKYSQLTYPLREKFPKLIHITRDTYAIKKINIPT